MRRKSVLAAAVAVIACIGAGGAAAHSGPGVFSSASAQAGAGFTINGSFTETGLLPGQPVTYIWSYHLVVGMGCGGKSVTDRVGHIENTIATTADDSGNVTESFSIGLPSLSCPGGQTPDPVKMMVRSIKIRDTTNHHRTRALGWFISKTDKGFTAQHPFHG
jgi:hypothetical protein